MVNNNFIILCNQRTGSTWIETSLGNLDSINTDYEIKWSEKLLLTNKSSYHFFLENKSLDFFFEQFDYNNKILGSKFIFDFYHYFPLAKYQDFINKFNNINIIHLRRNYIDILKSKLIGKVSHFIEKNNINKNRLIDKDIFKNQNFYYTNIKKNILKAKQNPIPFVKTSSYLYNLFINDLLSIYIKKRNKHINLNYEVINKQIKDIKKFLNLEEDEKTIKNFFFETPSLKKNTYRYPNAFEKYTDLLKLSQKLEKKLNELEKIDFEIHDIVKLNEKNNNLYINI